MPLQPFCSARSALARVSPSLVCREHWATVAHAFADARRISNPLPCIAHSVQFAVVTITERLVLVGSIVVAHSRTSTCCVALSLERLVWSFGCVSFCKTINGSIYAALGRAGSGAGGGANAGSGGGVGAAGGGRHTPPRVPHRRDAGGARALPRAARCMLRRRADLQ